MIPLRPPRRDCLLVAPERQRQELGWLGQALEAFDREEAVDAGKIVAQPCGEGEIIVAVALGRPDFEDNGDHTGLPRTFCAPWRYWASALCRAARPHLLHRAP